MKIGITGHTQGIGKSLYRIFQSNNHSVLGFSRSNGFDIGDKNSRENIVALVNDCDIFINNAYHPTGQFDLLEDILKSWDDQNKIIINISSCIIYRTSSMFSEEQLVYKDSKIKINNLINEYCGSVKILNVIPDLVNTEFCIIPAEYDKSQFIDPDDLASLIFDVCKYSNKFFIKELTIYGNFKD